MTTHDEYQRIADYIGRSDLPRKNQKLAGLRRAKQREIPMSLVCDPLTLTSMILVDGISIDPSELENGYWL